MGRIAMTNAVVELVTAAGVAAKAGRMLDAEEIWKKVLELDPNHAQALCNLGIHALRRGDHASARALLNTAQYSAPTDFVILMALASACRQLGDAVGEREAIDAALAVDPYFLPAHLARGDWLERHGAPATAAAAYKHTLRISPPDAQWPADFHQHLTHARAYVIAHAEALGEHLTRNLSALTASLPPKLGERWREAISIRAGLSEPYLSLSNQLCIPRLPAIPFFDREQFPQLQELETETEAIREELLAMLANSGDDFVPYIGYRAGDPVNQWSELNHSQRWSALHLWKGGARVEENLQRCPRTMKALERLHMADIDGLCPNALFSALAPHTQIPPHNGETNARLVAHLPLIVPDGCSYRVGFEHRKWEVGKCLIFDDTLEHEARNDSDELRVVLIFDLWNPHLSEHEKELVSALAKSTREFRSDPP